MEEILHSGTTGVSSASVNFAGKSAASWPAIIAGAFVAAGTSLILLALGAGLGFAAISPWFDRGISGTTFTVATAIWLIVTQWISAALGGYIAGRLRTRWIGTHSHEVFFRDTAHGLVTWAVATVVVAVVAGTSIESMVGAGFHAAPGAVSAGAQDVMSTVSSPVSPYAIDRLFRSAGAADGRRSAGDPRAQAAPIMANAISTGSVPDNDRSYLADLVAETTGIAQADAQKRVAEWLANGMEAETKIKANADMARKAASQAAIYTALALLIGAFIASVSAALGGRLRDEHP
jgi:hypothetical protein